MKVRANKDLETFLAVYDTFREYLKENSDELSYWVPIFDQMLDEHSENDGFGTEGQNDPRGDGRDRKSRLKWDLLVDKCSDVGDDE